jgi:glycosyltransferase involved in cell wall biosynthesis
MDPLKISIVIPAYNEAEVISDTLVAVLAQDYKNKEIIVVNNASKDNTFEVASRFPVKVVTEDKKGLLHARERGRVEATGDIIVNIDADCLPETDWLTRGAKHFENAAIVGVTGPYDYHDGGFVFRNVSLAFQKNIYHPMSIFLQLPFVKGGAVLIGGNNFIRSEVLKKFGGYDTSILFYGEDTDTAKKVAKHGKVKFDRSLHMKTSARRFKQEGTVKITLKYLFHFFKVILSPQLKRK